MSTALHVPEPWFTLVKNGKKTVIIYCHSEGMMDLAQQLIKRGSTLMIYSTYPLKHEIGHHILVRVTDWPCKYDSFKSMLDMENISDVLPGINSIDEGIKIYYQFENYQTNESNGVLAIRLYC